MTTLTAQDIQQARERIKDVVYPSPCARSESLSQLLGCSLSLKLENLQMTGSFKERGAFNKILQLNEQQRAEGAGAVGFAALYNQRFADLAGKEVVVLISGGNIDMSMLARILDRGLERDGRLSRLRVIVPDKPGSIAKLAVLIAEHQANILEISQNRSVAEVELGETEIELLLETRGAHHAETIATALRQVDFTLK